MTKVSIFALLFVSLGCLGSTAYSEALEDEIAAGRCSHAMNLRQEVRGMSDQINKKVVGQKVVIERLLLALLLDGHVLIEGPTGIAKTLLATTIAETIGGTFQRIQMTPDKMPTDIIGTEIFDYSKNKYVFHPGDIFANILLVDELNRASPRTQAGLLEAMEERQVTVGGQSRPLPEDVFFVIATQNPNTHEGTYPIPEAQLDRFLFKINMGHLSLEDERDMLRLVRNKLRRVKSKPSEDRKNLILAVREEINEVTVPEDVEAYVLDLVFDTRSPERWPPEFRDSVVEGTGPRATIGLDRAARALAWLQGRNQATIDDVREVAPYVLVHRVKMSRDAVATGRTAEDFISAILARRAPKK